MSKLFNALRDVLTPYANKINLHTEEIEHLKNGEVVIDGVLVQGFYPVATGTISTASRSARTAVFPVESGETYYVSWLEGTNKYRVAFGDVPANQIVNGTAIYNYIDATSLSHDHLSVTNDNHQYMYVYIGNTSSATINTVQAVKKIATSIDDCIAQNDSIW